MAKLRGMVQKVPRTGTFDGENGTHRFSQDQLGNLANQTSRMIADDLYPPVVAEEENRHPTFLHESTPNPEADPLYRGRVIGAFLHDGWLNLACDLIGENLPDDMRSSVWVEPALQVAGRTYSPGLRHLLLTPEPAVRDQPRPVFLRTPSSHSTTIGGAALSHDDRILLERFKWHRAIPHTFPHPGHRLRVEALLAAESAGFRGSSILLPPVKSIPPDDEKMLFKVLKSGLGMELTEEEALEADQHLHRMVWVKDSGVFSEAGRMAKLLFADRLTLIADRLNESVDPAVAYANPPRGSRLALGYQQAIPADTEKVIWRLIDKELGLDLSNGERDGIKYFLLSHSWAGDTSVYSIAQEIIDSWVNDRVGEFKQKVRPEVGPKLSAGAQLFRFEETLRQARERRAIVESIRAACPWMNTR